MSVVLVTEVVLAAEVLVVAEEVVMLVVVVSCLLYSITSMYDSKIKIGTMLETNINLDSAPTC